MTGTTGMHRVKGFTIIELMMTLVIASILASVALPSFLTTIENNQLASQSNVFVGTVAMARSESIKQGATITIISNSGTDWSDGWCLSVGTANCNGTVIQKYPPVAGQLTLSGDQSIFSFNSRGYLSSASGTLKLCKSSGKTGQQITINASGRANGQRITCP
jgi:type IV fimbrial biogenesis protein FimT